MRRSIRTAGSPLQRKACASAMREPGCSSDGTDGSWNRARCVRAAAEQAKQKLIAMAIADRGSPVYGARVDDVDFQDGNVVSKAEPAKAEKFALMLKRNGNQPLEATAAAKPQLDPQKIPCHSF